MKLRKKWQPGALFNFRCFEWRGKHLKLNWALGGHYFLDFKNWGVFYNLLGQNYQKFYCWMFFSIWKIALRMVNFQFFRNSKIWPTCGAIFGLRFFKHIETKVFLGTLFLDLKGTSFVLILNFILLSHGPHEKKWVFPLET